MGTALVSFMSDARPVASTLIAILANLGVKLIGRVASGGPLPAEGSISRAIRVRLASSDARAAREVDAGSCE
jgi:hypothetical protein